jgi:adenylate cyclase
MRRGLFSKYVVLLVGLVIGVLMINAALDLYFVYRDNRRATIEVQNEKAKAAAQSIEAFVREIERQFGWVRKAAWADLPTEQRRLDYIRLLTQELPIMDLVQLDGHGREQLRVSRSSRDIAGAGTDRSADPAFVEAMAKDVYFGEVDFREGSEPYLTMAVASGRKSAVTIADVNLKLIWEVVSQIKVGKDGQAYVVDRLGRLVAHPDISLVLRRTDMSGLVQVAAALKPQGQSVATVDGRNLAGVPVLSAHAPIPALGWLVFVELPSVEAEQPVIDTGLRALGLLVLGLLIAVGAGALLARHMVVPIRALRAGAERIGGGDLAHRLSIRTGDELEALAEQFNRSTAALEESHAGLEQKVKDRTAELRESLEQQTAIAEILRVISQSPTDLKPVLDAVAKTARRFCGADAAAVALREGPYIVRAALEGSEPGLEQAIGGRDPLDRSSATGRSILDGQTIHVPDILAPEADELQRARQNSKDSGIRTLAAAPMIREGQAIGSLLLIKTKSEPFAPQQIKLLETLAAQAVIAIENVRLLGELRERTDQVAELNRGLEARVAEQVEELGRVGRLKRFLAPQLAELIVSQGDEKILESHRREIVVVFCDLRGYTAFAETAEPEEVLDFLREYHGALGPLVSQFEGTLDQFSGDGIMVFFNDPVPIPDPAERAVKMAVAMREAASSLTAAWRMRGRELGFGAGIAQGYATLGQIGFSERSGYTAIGTVCNVAARLCGEARDGQILLDQRVNVALKGSVATEQVGALALKGLTQPVVTYNVPLAASQPALRVIDGGNH